MPSPRYKDYFISVFHLPDRTSKSWCVPFVEIRYKRGCAPEARLMLKKAFSDACGANAYGFAMGKQWVDERIGPNEPLTSAEVTKPEPQPIRSRLSSWLAFVLLCFGPVVAQCLSLFRHDKRDGGCEQECSADHIKGDSNVESQA